MSLRRSPQLTPASLAARRANALQSTGPRTAVGKARSCLNSLRHGRRARDLRAKLARIGDSEALFLLDWFHHHMLWFWRPRKQRTWRYTVRLAARAWCFMNGLSLRPRAGETQEEVDRKRDFLSYRYGDARGYPERPQGLKIGYKSGLGIKFLNPTPTRRKHLLLGWLPEFHYVPGPPRKVKRVRKVGSESEDSYRATPGVDPHPTPSRGQALRVDDTARLNSRLSLSLGQASRGDGNPGLDSGPSLWPGQALGQPLHGDDAARFETPFPSVIPAKGGIHGLSQRPPEKLPPPLEGGTKNLVRTKLECAEESVTCQDSGNPWSQGSPEAVISPSGDRVQSVCVGSCLQVVGETLAVAHGRAGTGPAPTATAPRSSSCDGTLGEHEPRMFMDPEDDDPEVLEASHALIELQWSKWRQAVGDTRADVS